MGHIRNAIAELEKQEGEGSGWMERKMGELDLVQDAVPAEYHGQLDQIRSKLEKPRHARGLLASETGLVHRLHRDYVRPAITDSVRHETALERAEKAKGEHLKRELVRPDATQTDAGQGAVPTPRKRAKK